MFDAIMFAITDLVFVGRFARQEGAAGAPAVDDVSCVDVSAAPADATRFLLGGLEIAGFRNQPNC